MTKVKFHYTDIQNIAIPRLEESLLAIKRASSEASRMDIPSEFSYAGFLRNLSSQLSHVSNELQTTKEWLHRSNVNYERRTAEIVNQINDLASTEIPKREKIVKNLI